jgi:hypothetical protein
MEIVPNVHLIPGIIANSYLIIETQGLTLIDAGLPGSHKKILRYMTSLGYAPKGLKRIIITHADFDHVVGWRLLKQPQAGVSLPMLPKQAQLQAGVPPARSNPPIFLPDGSSGSWGACSRPPRPRWMKSWQMGWSYQSWADCASWRHLGIPLGTFRCMRPQWVSCFAAIRSFQKRGKCAAQAGRTTGIKPGRMSLSGNRLRWVQKSFAPGMAWW